MTQNLLDKNKLLKKLDRIEYSPDSKTGDEPLSRMSLAGSLLALAGIDHDSEYALCAKVARHLLGSVPEPDEILPAED